MSSFSSTQTKVNPKNVLGGILGSYDEYDETKFEKESFLSSAVKGLGSVLEDTISLVTDNLPESGNLTEIPKVFVDAFKNEPEYKLDPTKPPFPSNGSIEFKQKQAKEIEKAQEDKTKVDKKRAFFQALKEDQDRARQAKYKLLFEEEVNDIATNLSTDEKNALLHYQASYRDRSIYQKAELKRKILEQRKKSEKQAKQASITSPAKQPSAMEGAFEGRSGAQGSGTSNLSAQAVG